MDLRGRPNAWAGVRRLKSRPDCLRQRVGRDLRLIFKVDAEAVEFVDLIRRRDLEAWLRKG
ncbi:MAG: hypothetical protein R3F11_28420 [Verrucomicrobiales bacterium]